MASTAHSRPCKRSILIPLSVLSGTLHVLSDMAATVSQVALAGLPLTEATQLHGQLLLIANALLCWQARQVSTGI